MVVEHQESSPFPTCNFLCLIFLIYPRGESKIFSSLRGRGFRVELTFKIGKKSEKKAIAVDELSMFKATKASFIDKILLIWLIFSDKKNPSKWAKKAL